MDALDAKVPFDRFGKELRFVSVGLGDFASVLQSWIVALTLWLKEVFDSASRLVGVRFEVIENPPPYFPACVLKGLTGTHSLQMFSKEFY